MRRRNRFLLVLSLLIVVAGYVLWRDLTLPQRAREAEKTEILVQNLELEREISGDIFRFKAKEARKMQGERIEAFSLDVGATLSGKENWELRSVSGSLEPQGEIRLSEVFARNLRKGENLDIEAKQILWNPQKREWNFDGGVLVRQGSLKAGGTSGTAAPDGHVTLSGEAWATWEKP